MTYSDIDSGDYAENMRKKIAQQGLIYLFTGGGKGKTSAALGILLRALSHGWKVGWVSWYKQQSWGISEHEFPKMLKKTAAQRLTFDAQGKGFFLGKNSNKKNSDPKMVQAGKALIVDAATTKDHMRSAHEAFSSAQKLLPKVDILFLDEICNALADNLIQETHVLELLKKRGAVHIVMTGRSASKKLIDLADLVSEINNIKHPFDKGKMAVKGLDF